MSDKIKKNDDIISDDEYYYIEVTDMDCSKWLGWSGGANRCGLYHTSEPNAVPFPIETLNCKEMQDFLEGRKYIIHSNKENLQCRRKRLCYPENLKIIYRKNYYNNNDEDNENM